MNNDKDLLEIIKAQAKELAELKQHSVPKLARNSYKARFKKLKEKIDKLEAEVLSLRISQKMYNLNLDQNKGGLPSGKKGL